MEHSVHDGITISPYPKGLTPPFQEQPPTPHPISENPEPPPRLPSYTYAHTHTFKTKFSSDLKFYCILI